MKIKFTVTPFIALAFIACEESNTPSKPFIEEPSTENAESCSWVYEVVDQDSDTRLEYGELCVEGAKGDLPKEVCEGKHKGQKGSLCSFEEPAYTCKNLMLDKSKQIIGNGYIANKGLFTLIKNQALLSNKEICDIFLEEFLN